MLSIDDERTDDLVSARYPAFGGTGGTRFDETESYEGDGTPIAHSITYQWNWSVGEVVTAVLDAGLRLDGLTEHTTVPWAASPALMHPVGPLGEYELADRPHRLPCTYTLQASKPV